jgi:hypothetical protein
MQYPAWVYRHRQKGTHVVRKGDNYYLYKVRSVWSREKGRAQLKTEKYLGKITPEGIVGPKHERVLERMKHVTIKEYGASAFIESLCNGDVIPLLKERFIDRWREIFVFAVMRLLYNSPIKNLEFHHATSYLSELIPDAHVSDRSVGEMLREIGMDRAGIDGFMKNFVSGTEYAIVDITHIFSLSEGIISSMMGHNSKEDFSPQINTIYLFSLDRKMPAYFRILVGSINSVSSLNLTIRESGASNVVLIGDKGFYSNGNVVALEKEGLHYVLPLKRDSSLIDYGRVRKGDKRALRYFVFEGRPIWYHRYPLEEEEGGGRSIFLFLDERLKTEEEKDFLARTERGDRERMKLFYRMQYRIGTIAVMTDIDERDGQKVYELLKCRIDIEQLFDTLKNTLHSDRTYMRDDYQLEGWMFVNFVALIIYYKIYNALVGASLLKSYSPKDVLLHLSRMHKLKIGEEWVPSEVPKKTREIIEELDLHIV